MSFGKCLVFCGLFTVSYIMVLPIPKDNFYKVMLGNLLCDSGSSTLCSKTTWRGGIGWEVGWMV